MLLRHSLSTLCFCTLAALPLATLAAPKYAVAVVGVAGSSAAGINSSGTVVGDFPVGGSKHGFVNAGGVITDLGTLGGSNSFAVGINNAGNIVGRSDDGVGHIRAFLYAGGAMTDLGTLGGPNSRAEAINNLGDIVGSADVPALYASAFLLRPGVQMQEIGMFDVPDSEGGSIAKGINDKRKVVGGSALGPFTPPESPDHAFIYACEEMSDLGTLGGQYSVATAINQHGVIVGEASTPSLMHNRAFSYYKGKMKNLGILPGGDLSSARDINDAGQVVGYAMGATGQVAWKKAFLMHQGVMHDLNTLIGPFFGWSLRDASGINNSGQIAATGCKAGVCHALRLDPLP